MANVSDHMPDSTEYFHHQGHCHDKWRSIQRRQQCMARQASLIFLQSICQNFPKNLKEQAISTLQQFVNSLEVSTSSTSPS
jgi:hypothetical protein